MHPKTMMSKSRGRSILIALLILMILICPGITAAQDDDYDDPKEAFAGLIDTLKAEETVPAVTGHFVSLGDYEDTYTNMSNCLVIPLLEAEHFVFSADLAWTSAIMTPDSQVSGCGVVFSAAEDSTNHLLASLRMDGNFYMTGLRTYGEALMYGKVPFSRPSREGAAKLTLVVDGNNVTAYVNGSRVLRRSNVPMMGNQVGLAILSGTNYDFGTRCTFSDMMLYTWEEGE